MALPTGSILRAARVDKATPSAKPKSQHFVGHMPHAPRSQASIEDPASPTTCNKLCEADAGSSLQRAASVPGADIGPPLEGGSPALASPLFTGAAERNTKRQKECVTFKALLRRKLRIAADVAIRGLVVVRESDLQPKNQRLPRSGLSSPGKSTGLRTRQST